MTGRQFGATEACRLGLVNRVAASADLLDEAIALAEDLARKPPLALAAALWAVHHGLDASIDEGLAVEEATFGRIIPSRDAQEGVVALLRKCRPEFLGR